MAEEEVITQPTEQTEQTENSKPDYVQDKFWTKDFGDRRQQIVFIGLKSEMNEKNIRERLDDCLIKNYCKNPNTHHKALDPFPAWFQKVA